MSLNVLYLTTNGNIKSLSRNQQQLILSYLILLILKTFLSIVNIELVV